MSQPESAAEQEVDFGRYWLAIIRRWWLPIGGVVAGLIVGVLLQTGGARPYRAVTSVYLGQAFAPGSVSPVQSLPTRLSIVQKVITERERVKKVALQVGIPPGRLRAAITTKALGVTSGTKEVSAPLVEIAVVNPSARKAVDAVAALADATVTEFSSYVDVKLATYRLRLSRADRERVKVAQRITVLQGQLDEVSATKTLPATEKYLTVASLNNQLQFNQQRDFGLESSQFALKDSIALAEQVERARVVESATATRVAGSSKRSGGAVGMVIGFVLGLLAAIFWEPSTRLVKRARTAD